MQDFERDQDISTNWIESLALDELNMEESGVVDLHDHLNPIHLLEESSIKLMNQLRDRFELYVSKFNEYRGNEASGAQIKIFKISNTVNDFMLFRHSLRLVFARKSNDLISIGFLSNGREFIPAHSEIHGPEQANFREINAHLGPFNKTSWRFQGEEIEIDALVRYYISEFIKQSAR